MDIFDKSDVIAPHGHADRCVFVVYAVDSLSLLPLRTRRFGLGQGFGAMNPLTLIMTQLREFLDELASKTNPFTIYSIYLSRHIVYLGVCLASVVNASPSLQSNTPMQINELASTRKRTLAWPPHIPWTMDITKEVSITMKHNGRFANPSGWKDIEEALGDLEQRFADTERPTDLSCRSRVRHIQLWRRHARHRQPAFWTTPS